MVLRAAWGLLVWAGLWAGGPARALQLGVCYYPEQWGAAAWRRDAQRMAELGLTYIRIAEFSWALLEPQPTQYAFEWLDDALEALGGQGLKVVLGTPTATPPKWLVDQNPDILPVGVDGQVRKFGSRRHYSFSSPAYWSASQQIVTALAQRYGTHPAVAGWQLDNEFGCHDTVRSYDPAARAGFQVWLQQHYGNISNLNAAWGTVFWSQTYSTFEAVDLPNLAVTEANPSAWLDFYRYSSDAVTAYATMQATIIRQYSPDRFITHNFMGFFPDFDHFQFQQGALLDFAAWDSYPLGFTDVFLGTEEIFSEAEKLQFSHTGHPDLAAFHHDLYYRVGRGPFWVMEQQPGPVNWAGHNPSPAPGMVRLWSLEALAHGAAVVSYFRWRQAPFAQEQLHSGLYRPDDRPDAAVGEVRRVLQDLRRLAADGGRLNRTQSLVALLYDYEAQWVLQIQRHGQEVGYARLVFRWYSALRGFGVPVDIVAAGQPLTGYAVVFVPSLPYVSPEASRAFADYKGLLVLGPRTGSRTLTFQLPEALPPGPGVQPLLPIKVTRVESRRPGDRETVTWRFAAPRARRGESGGPRLLPSKSAKGTGRFGGAHAFEVWREHLELLDPRVVSLGEFADGSAAVVKADQPGGGEVVYLAFWPLGDFLPNFLQAVLAAAHVPHFLSLPSTIRVSHCGDYMWAFNYGSTPQALPVRWRTPFVIGGSPLEPYGVACWRRPK